MLSYSYNKHTELLLWENNIKGVYIGNWPIVILSQKHLIIQIIKSSPFIWRGFTFYSISFILKDNEWF